MTTREEALRLADALDKIWPNPNEGHDATALCRAATLLRQWPEAAPQEPVAWMWLLDGQVWDLSSTKDRYTPMRDGHVQVPLYAAPPLGWMPIESAPKSKDDILLISRNGNTRIDTGGFAHHMMNAAKVDGDECIFTHWMPLPPPPGAEQPDQWRQAIDDELVTAHIGTADAFPDARAALKAVIAWHVQVALDPAVSSDAQALIDRGAAQPAGMVLVPRKDFGNAISLLHQAMVGACDCGLSTPPALAWLRRAIGAGEPVAYALVFEGDSRLCLSTVFDTREDAQRYADTCKTKTEIVPLFAAPPAAQPAPSIDKVKTTHTSMRLFDFEQNPDHEYKGLPHRVYTQSNKEGCYLCACLAEIERLKAQPAAPAVERKPLTDADIDALQEQATAPEWRDDTAQGWHMGMNYRKFARDVLAAGGITQGEQQ